MALFEPYIPTQRESYEYDLWGKEECYRFYITERRRNCTFRQIMNLWLQAPYCFSCASSDPFIRNRQPDIDRHWQEDMTWQLDNETFRRIKKELRKNPDFALICKRCGIELRPWKGEEVWVVSYHLEEHYQIPLEKSGRKTVSRKVRNQIFTLYDQTCFGCAATDKPLHLDHILPQSKGGDSAFRNLQPLCETCGNLKGDDLPEEVDVYSDVYFGPYPSDGYMGLFG